MAAAAPPARKRLTVSLRIKILIGFTLIFGVVFAAAYYWFYTFSTRMAMSRIREDLQDTLQGAIAGVDGDDFAAMVAENPPCIPGVADDPQHPLVPDGDPRYQAHQKWLESIVQIEPRASPYTYIAGPRPDTLQWAGDGYRFLNPDEATCFMEVYTKTAESVILEGLTRTTINMNIYSDAWGSWVSAYGPILNSRGRVVGAMGIDFRADYVRQVQQGIRDSIVLAFVITYGSLFLLVYVASTVLTRPIVKLTRVAESIGEGNYDQDLKPLLNDRLPDEIDTLARTFEIMLDKVRQREQTLRRQVEELRIEIDEVKRQRQVTEITGTDFFQDLRQRARDMRRRSRGAEEGAQPAAEAPGQSAEGAAPREQRPPE